MCPACYIPAASVVLSVFGFNVATWMASYPVLAIGVWAISVLGFGWGAYRLYLYFKGKRNE